MHKLGRILGICGLVALLSVPLTLFLWDWQLTWVAVAKLVFGVAALAVWLLAARPSLGQTFRARPAFYGAFAGLFSVLAVVGLVVVNYLAHAHPLRWDLTRERIFSLSDQTLDVLGGLQDTVEVRAFYGPQEPEIESVRGWLERYRLASPRFAYELVDPVVRLEAVEKNKIVPGGPRVLLTYRGREERVRLGQTDASGPEEVLTGALLRLTQSGGERLLCFTSGHGERALTGEDPRQSMSLWARDLEGEGFRTQALSLLEVRQVPEACLAVVVAGPAQALAADELQALGAYLDRGGRLLVLVGFGDSGSLNDLLAQRGAQVTERAVIFPEGRSPLEVVTDPQQYPSTHPIFARFFQGGAVSLGQLQAVLPMARQLAVRQAAGALPMLVLASSSASAWAETDDITAVDQVAFDKERDVPGPVGLALVGEAAQGGARLAVFGSSLMACDAAYRVFPFNRNLLMNTLAWLVHEESKITIRPRLRAASLLRLEETDLKFITFLASDLLPLTILAFGITVWQLRRWA
jgi:ABC-type uncharacterized transport system involved in gliding motility auxiliary subunit